MATEFVRVTNLGDKPLVLAWNGARYPIAPGAQRTVPVEAAYRSFGWWEAEDGGGRDDRRIERQRLSTLYGTMSEPWYSQTPAQTAMSSEVYANGNPIVAPEDYDPFDVVDGQTQFMHPNLPKARVEDDNGQRLLTIIDDPLGEIVLEHPLAGAEGDELAMLKRTLSQVTARLQQLEHQPPEVHDLQVQTSPNPPAPVDPDEGGAVSADEVEPDAMDIMADAVEPTPKKKPARKRAAKKKAAAEPTSI
ncbi:MAG: hypothetical protein ACF8PN_08165 [Phycisphaerales bacterium]